jgi:spoIIIJ-associated protein
MTETETNQNSGADTRQAEVATDVVRDILAGAGLAADVQFSQEDEDINIDVTGDDLGFAIGRRAQTLDAIQLIAYLISAKAVDPDERRRVSVDIDEYRAAREEELFDLADRAVRDALASGQPVELKPMTSNERRSVHHYLLDNGDVDTHSVGEDPDRRIVVSPAGAKSPRPLHVLRIPPGRRTNSIVSPGGAWAWRSPGPRSGRSARLATSTSRTAFPAWRSTSFATRKASLTSARELDFPVWFWV